MVVYPMEFETPHRGLTWLQYYGAHKVYHPGQDFNFGIGNDDLGAEVKAWLGGTVEYISPVPSKWNNYNGGFGWFMIVYHPSIGLWSRYAHLRVAPKPNVGERVEAGEKIGECGNSGTTWAHLHFEIFNQKCWDIQNSHWRKFAWYPSGKSKSWVSDHYEDPMELIRNLMAENDSAKAWYKQHFPELYKKEMTEEECEQWRTFAKRIMSWTK